MYGLGIDIGSTATKVAIVDETTALVGSAIHGLGAGTSGADKALAEAFEATGLSWDAIDFSVATGYGRQRFERADKQLSELSCHARGMNQLLPGIRTIIDIGGQDAKVISLDEKGRMNNFLMNDKCAAGTGRFLDVMANILVVPVDEFAAYCEKSDNPAQISSTCTVFAESEVISQLANGVNMEDLIAGICSSVAVRVGNLAKRINIVPDVCMSGGVAQNAGVRNALSQSIGQPILFSPKAQLFGAIGAALYAYQKQVKK